MPPKIPTIEGRNIPQSRAGTPSFRAVEAPNTYAGAGIRAADMASTAGEGLKNIGTEIGAVVKEREEKQERYALASSKIEFMKESVAAQNELENDPDFSTAQQRYIKRMEEARARLAPKNVSNYGLQEWQLETEGMILDGGQKVYNSAQSKEKDFGRADVMRKTDDAVKLAVFSDNPYDANAALEGAIDVIENSSYLDEVEKYNAARKTADDFAIQKSKADPDKAGTAKRLDQIMSGKSANSPEVAIPATLKIEGGYTASDGASGQPAIYGINKKWWPAQHDEAVRITQEQGREAGIKYAEQFYKENFWDKNNIDELPENIRAVAFDTYVNHTPEFAKKAISEANGNPQKLLSLRLNEYKRLAQKPEYAGSYQGWVNRIGDLQKNIAPDYLKYASPDTQIAIREELDREIKQISNEAVSAITNEISLLSKGLRSPANKVNEFMQKARSSSTPEAAAALASYNAALQDAEKFKKMNPKQLQDTILTEILPAAQKQGATDDEIVRLEFANEYLRNAANSLYEDSITYAAGRGTLPGGVSPVDLGDPGSLAKRAADAKTVTETYGYSTIFTKDEATQFASTYASASPEEKVTMVRNIREGAGDMAAIALSEITKDSLPDEYLGGMAALSSSYDETAKLGFYGLDIMKKDPNRKPQEPVYAAMDDRSFFAVQNLDPETQAAFKGTVAAIYTGLGGDPKVMESDILNTAIRMAAGGTRGNKDSGIVDIEGRKTVLPPMVTGREFERAISVLDDDDIISMTAGNTNLYDRFGYPVTADDIRSKGYYRAVGQGEYQVFFSTDDLPVVDANGQPAIIKIDRERVDGLLFRKLVNQYAE